MGILETRIDKGTPVNKKDNNSKWVYFANPVVTFEEVDEVNNETINEIETDNKSENTNPFLQAQPVTEDELDLTKSFSKTIFQAGDLDDLKSIKTVKEHINDLNILRDCK